MDINKKDLTELIRNKAGETGFELCGFAPVSILHENGEILKKWCDAGMNAGMEYMAGNIDKRINPETLLPGARSVIVTGLNYFTERKQGGGDVPVISIYAYGKDYHEVIIKKLGQIADEISALRSGAVSKSYVDSAPVLEKAWAARAGLGWQGKHSVLINNKIGSFFFLGVILTTAELEYDSAAEDRCGSCTLCIDGCPVDAINDNRTIDARKCIAYLTIDNKAPVEKENIEKLGGRIVGCDRCQEVCPWNKIAVPHNHPEFEISDEFRNMTAGDWLNLSEDDHKRLFGHSAISRRKFGVFKQNVTNVTESLKPPSQPSPSWGKG